MADYAPRLDQRESLTQRERRIIDRTLGMDEQLLLVTRPDPSILKVELYIHFGIAALILMTSKAEPIILSFILPVTLLICVSPWLRKWNRRRTLYLVTDRRCIILSPRLLPGMKCESYALEPRLIKEHEIFNGGIGNIIFDYDGVSGPDPDGDDRTPLGFLDLPQCKRVVTLIRKQIKKLHQLDYLPPAPRPQEESFANVDRSVPFAGMIQDRIQEIKVEKES